MRVWIRTEGGFVQGMGDIWGSIAIAEALAPQMEIQFALSSEEEGAALLRERGERLCVVRSWDEEARALELFRPELALLNRLNNAPEYLRALRERVRWIVTLDDAGPAAALADLRINPLYWVEEALTGPEWVMLRDEFFLARRSPPRIAPRLERLLLTQGGSDTHGFLKQILRALRGLEERPELFLLRGPAFAEDSELALEIEAWGGSLRLIQNCKKMAELLGQMDLVITGAGLTLFECLCLGTPTLTVCAEPWELETAQRMEALGATVQLGFGRELEPAELRRWVELLGREAERRMRLARRGQELVDGRGSQRIAARLREWLKGASCELVE